MTAHPNIRAIPHQHAHVLQALREGNGQAFDYVFDLYYLSLSDFVMHKINDRDASDDIAAEAFTKFWNQRKKVRFSSIRQIKAYLYTTARNASLDFLSKQRLDKRYQQETIFLTAQENSDFYAEIGLAQRARMIQEVTRIVYELIKELPDGCGKIVTLYYIEQLPIKEIAARLGISQGTVKSQRGYGVDLLRKKYAKRTLNLERYCL